MTKQNSNVLPPVPSLPAPPPRFLPPALGILTNCDSLQAVASAQAVAASATPPLEAEAPPVDRYITDFGVGIQFRPKGAPCSSGPEATMSALGYRTEPLDNNPQT